MLKSSDNPPILAAGVETLTDFSGRWWVAHTKSRFEKAFAWDLLHRGIGYFLPMVERVRICSGKKRRVLLSLFPGYVFFCGTEKDRHAAMTTNRLCRTLNVVDQERLVVELAAVERALKNKTELDPYPDAAIGHRCRIKSGVLEGLEGVVVQRNRRARLVLEVSMLGQGAAIEIDADLLEGID